MFLTSARHSRTAEIEIPGAAVVALRDVLGARDDLAVNAISPKCSPTTASCGIRREVVAAEGHHHGNGKGANANVLSC
ncbi:hypothetical protein [Roseomonas mucosa]|uniref:hypothetical protein n=1 Tax=Roseomonas mucosa TaxID=207340 RepID=UPI0028CFD211|nr:hypothetical protein [Roseomonas mucosa]MDT8356775.1 hypothetical protein [Roseomonas mucosa]